MSRGLGDVYKRQIYIVGEDIPSGTYSIYGNNIATFGLYNSEEEHQKSNWEMLHIVDKDKGSSVGKAVLLDGQVVTVSGTARFETYRGLDFK